MPVRSSYRGLFGRAIRITTVRVAGALPRPELPVLALTRERPSGRRVWQREQLALMNVCGQVAYLPTILRIRAKLFQMCSQVFHGSDSHLVRPQQTMKPPASSRGARNSDRQLFRNEVVRDERPREAEGTSSAPAGSLDALSRASLAMDASRFLKVVDCLRRSTSRLPRLTRVGAQPAFSSPIKATDRAVAESYSRCCII
jgi:hypothetical protein